MAVLNKQDSSNRRKFDICGRQPCRDQNLQQGRAFLNLNNNEFFEPAILKELIMPSSNFSHSFRTQALGLAGWLLVTFAAAALGAIASVDAASFYGALIKPTWAPPASVFSPVWSILYLLMGIAVWLVWREPQATKHTLGLFIVQLIVNALWSWLFFVWHLGAWAFAGVLLLLLLILATQFAFWKISRMAGILLIPYLLWVGFASVLTWTIWQNNPILL